MSTTIRLESVFEGSSGLSAVAIATLPPLFWYSACVPPCVGDEQTHIEWPINEMFDNECLWRKWRTSCTIAE